jgi:hypothetical protein
VTSGYYAWLRVTVADLPTAASLAKLLSTRRPGPNWKRESQDENLEVSGLPAARVAFTGQWHNQDYLSETAVVHKGEHVYLFSVGLPASDNTAREQVRQAVGRATWQ